MWAGSHGFDMAALELSQYDPAKFIVMLAANTTTDDIVELLNAELVNASLYKCTNGFPSKACM